MNYARPAANQKRNVLVHLNMLWVYSIINILLFQSGDRLQTSESDVYGRQILTSKVGPRAKRVA